MPCKHLSCYSPASSSWSVASCSFKGTPYVPSMQELENYCTTGSHEQCPVIFQSLPPLHDECFWPELEVIALAQRRYGRLGGSCLF